VSPTHLSPSIRPAPTTPCASACHAAARYAPGGRAERPLRMLATVAVVAALVVASPPTARAQVLFPASLDLSGLEPGEGFTLLGTSEGDSAGFSISGAGDLNGDGRPDLVVGAPFRTVAVGAEGETYVVFGRDGEFLPFLPLANLDGANGFAIEGVDSSDLSGFDVAAAGDVNRDGFDDLVIGAPGASVDFELRTGEAYVVLGRPAFPPRLRLATLAGSDGFVLQGEDGGDLTGASVSGAGDVNGDGIDDLLVGAPLADPDDRPVAGVTYVVFGSEAPFPALVDLTTLDGTNGFEVHGGGIKDQSGGVVAGIGDVNHDGIDDIAVAAAAASPNGIFAAGEVYVIFGRATPWPAAFDVRDLDGSNGFTLNGGEPNANAGVGLASAGDLDGDGIVDFVVGAPGAGPLGRDVAGSAYVVFGRPEFPAVIELAELGDAGFRLDGPAANARFGDSAAAAGDVDDDGRDDLVVGAPITDAATGSGFVVFGRPDFPETLDTATLDGEAGFRIDGIAPGDSTGDSVAGVGDANGDGVDDVALGAPFADFSARENAGKGFVVHGRSCRKGTVGGAAEAEPILTVNDETGTVVVSPGDEVVVRLRAPQSGPADGRYVLWVWDGAGEAAVELAVSGERIGCTVNPTPLLAGSPPQPVLCIRPEGIAARACAGTVEKPGPATLPLARARSAFASPRTVVLQAAVDDDGAGNPLGLSVSNAVVLVVE